MKLFTCIFLFLVVFSPSLWAGEIYGNIQEGRRPVGSGTRVEIFCGQRLYSTTTDQYGSYRLFIPEKGKCVFVVHYGQSSPSIEIYSYDGSTRYDLILEKKGAQFFLQRK